MLYMHHEKKKGKLQFTDKMIGLPQYAQRRGANADFRLIFNFSENLGIWIRIRVRVGVRVRFLRD